MTLGPTPKQFGSLEAKGWTDVSERIDSWCQVLTFRW
jgi:hypothetical protein